MRSINKQGQPKLHLLTQLVLYSSSYLPLSLLLLIRNCIIEKISITKLIKISLIQGSLYILTTFVLLCMSILGSLGLWCFIKQMKKDVNNGFPYKVVEVYSKKAETIGYIATYIIPFAFQSYHSTFEYIALLLFLGLTFTIYRDSTLLTINPILSLYYSIFEVRFIENDAKKTGIIIIRDNDLTEEDKIILYRIGNKLYFGKTITNEE